MSRHIPWSPEETPALQKKPRKNKPKPKNHDPANHNNNHFQSSITKKVQWSSHRIGRWEELLKQTYRAIS